MYYTMKEVSDKLAISIQLLYYHIKKGNIPHTIVGKKTFLDDEQLEYARSLLKKEEIRNE